MAMEQERFDAYVAMLTAAKEAPAPTSADLQKQLDSTNEQISQLQKQAAELEQQIKDLQAKEKEAGAVIK